MPIALGPGQLRPHNTRKKIFQNAFSIRTWATKALEDRANKFHTCKPGQPIKPTKLCQPFHNLITAKNLNKFHNLITSKNLNKFQSWQ